MSPEQKQRRRLIDHAHHQNHYAVVDSLSRSYIQEFPLDAKVRLWRATMLITLCRYAEAEELLDFVHYEDCVELHPFVWTFRGDLYVRRSNFIEAEHCYFQADYLMPNTSWILIKLAHSTWLGGDLEKARQFFQHALTVEEHKQDRDEALFNLGGVLVALGRLEEAANCYREALALSPDYEIAQLRLDDVELALKLHQATD